MFVPPSVVDTAHRAEEWLAALPRETLLRACLDNSKSFTLSEQLSRAGCGNVWFLPSYDRRPVETFETVYEDACWVLHGGGSGGGTIPVLETPLTRRWMLSNLAFKAAWCGHIDALELLLTSPIFRQGYTDAEYQTLLDHIAHHWATTSGAPMRAVDMANLLLSHGCNVESLHGAGHFGSRDVDRVLVDHGSYLYGLDTIRFQRSHAAYLRAMVAAGASPSAFAWRAIVSSGSTEVVQLFIEAWYLDLDARLPDAHNWTLLMVAVSRADVTIVAELLDHGADLTLTDDRGRTALAIATMVRNEAAVKLLLARGADPKHVDNEGRNILERARELSVPGLRLVETLLQYGARR